MNVALLVNVVLVQQMPLDARQVQRLASVVPAVDILSLAIAILIAILVVVVLLRYSCRARVTTATAVNPGDFASMRRAYRKS